MATKTELQAALEATEGLTERDLNELIRELVDRATHQFGTCIAIEDILDKIIYKISD